MVSPKFELVEADKQKLFYNAKRFGAIALTFYVSLLVTGYTPQEALPVLYLFIINQLYDLLRKWVSQTEYK